MIYFGIYALIINLVGFIMMLLDKRAARLHLRRISENALITVAAVGGSVGVLSGMYKAHHKTRKPKFKFGVPAIIVAQIGLLILHFLIQDGVIIL